MTIQTASLAATQKRRRTRVITAAAGAALALAAAAGIGAWQAGRHSVDIAGPPAASMPAPTTVSPAAGRGIDAAPRYYLVASPAEAAALQVALDDSAVLRAALGEPVSAERVALLDSAEAGAVFLEAASMEDALRGALGLPPARVIDLRGG